MFSWTDKPDLKHKIATICDIPILQRAYRFIKAEIHHQVEDFKAHGLIEDSANPVVMVNKKDGTYTVDYRKPNSLMHILSLESMVVWMHCLALSLSPQWTFQVDTGKCKWFMDTDPKRHLQVMVSTNSK